MRELLDTKVLEALVWLDTRDMVADGLTKGSVDRDAGPARQGADGGARAQATSP